MLAFFKYNIESLNLISRALSKYCWYSLQRHWD